MERDGGGEDAAVKTTTRVLGVQCGCLVKYMNYVQYALSLCRAGTKRGTLVGSVGSDLRSPMQSLLNSGFSLSFLATNSAVFA